MNVRKFDATDQKAVKDLIISIVTKEYPFDRNAYSDSDLNSIGDTYAGAREVFLVLEADGQLIGTIGVKEESSDSALIRRFFVHENFRNMGYGSKLMNEALEFCRLKGYQHALFQGTSKMIKAIELCKKKGFIEKERIDMGGFFICKFILEL